MILNSTLSSACHSERSEESALPFLKCVGDRFHHLPARAANAINAARSLRKVLPGRAGNQDRPAKASQPSYTPPAHVPYPHAVRKSHPFRKTRPTPSDSQSWSVRTQQALPPAFPVSRKSSLARRENPAGKNRVSALAKSPRSLCRHLLPSNRVLRVASTPRHTWRPSQSPAATNRASRRNHFSAPVHSLAAPSASLASGFLSFPDRFSKKLQTPPTFSAPARMLRRIRTRERAKTASPNPRRTFQEGVRASQSLAGNDLWFARGLRLVVRAKEFFPGAIGRADFAAVAQQPSSRRARPLYPGSGRSRFSPACNKRERFWDRAPEFSLLDPALSPNLLSLRKRRPVGSATRRQTEQAQAPRADALSPRRKFAALFRGRRERRAVSHSADVQRGPARGFASPRHSCERPDTLPPVRFRRSHYAERFAVSHRSWQSLRSNLLQPIAHELAAVVSALAAKALAHVLRKFPAPGESRRRRMDETSAKYNIHCLPFRLTRGARENYKQRLRGILHALALPKGINVYAA